MRGRLPPGVHFESRHDVGRHCRHEPRAVVVVGNVDRRTFFRCHDCLNEVVPVWPGWEWDRRRQEHLNLAAQRASRAAGRPGAYMERDGSPGSFVRA